MKKALFVLAFFLVLLAAAGLASPVSADDPTETPTQTPTPTETPTPSQTFTPSLTYTPSTTPTPTVTLNPSVAWAPSTISVSHELYNAMALALIADPPDGISGPAVYAVTAADAAGLGGWYISLVHLTDVAAPYEDWNVIPDADWLGSLTCLGGEGAWNCDYFTILEGSSTSGAEGGLLFPWQSGTWAKYGPQGVHFDYCGGACALPNHNAVDFMGADTWGADVMPAKVYAASSGTVSWHCDGARNSGFRMDGPSGSFVYFHLQPGQVTNDMSFARGQYIGLLTYGNFDDSPCGVSTINETNGYHLHFEFIPQDGFFMIGGCTLNVDTEQWLCGNSTIRVNGQLLNGGGSAPIPTVTPGGPTVTPGVGEVTEGGEHIWNGLISGLISFTNSTVEETLPPHTPLGVSDWGKNISSTLTDYSSLFFASGLIYITPTFLCVGVIMTLEVFRVIVAFIRLIYGLIPAAA